jgi:hypothetical protein
VTNSAEIFKAYGSERRPGLECAASHIRASSRA